MVSLSNSLFMSNYTRKLLVVVAMFAFLLDGCSQEQEDIAQTPTSNESQAIQPVTKKRLAESSAPAVQPDVAHVFLIEATPVEIVEVIPDAIPQWRAYSKRKPTLVLLSQNPFLYKPPTELHDEVSDLVLNGTTEDIIKKGRLSSANPVLPLQQAVRASLAHNFFNKVIWVLPTPPHEERDLDYNRVTEQLLEADILKSDERETLNISTDRITGTIEGTPLIVTTLDNLPAISERAIIHFDLSFFSSTYQNAVTTPIHGMVKSSLEKLRERSIPSYLTTVSLTTGPQLVPLNFRFLGGDLQTLIDNPEILDQTLPDSWLKRHNILYLEYFFKPAETRRLVDELLQEIPQDPWVHYWDYKIKAKDDKAIEAALKSLDHAISLDPGYADEYLELAERARQRGLIKQARIFLEKARETFPDNVFIELDLTDMELAKRSFDEALERIRRLQKLEWSPHYHPTIPEMLVDMEALALAPPLENGSSTKSTTQE